MNRELRGRLLRWRVAHQVVITRWRAHRNPTDRNWEAYDRATDLLEHIDMARAARP